MASSIYYYYYRFYFILLCVWVFCLNICLCITVPLEARRGCLQSQTVVSWLNLGPLEENLVLLATKPLL